MARRIFISFLGTGNYTPCVYAIEGRPLTSNPVRFVQEALVRHFCMDEGSPWKADDRILVFCTHFSDINGKRGAVEINWRDNYLKPHGLEYRLNLLKEQGLAPSVEMTLIPSGFNEQEVWGIFSTVYDKLKEVLTDPETGQVMKGELYFDVTHAFRSIPLFAMVLFNHTKVLLGTELKAIKYGAFEAPDSNGYTPVLDLTSIAQLQTYNQLANDFKEFGKIKNLSSELHKTTDSTGDTSIYLLSRAIAQLHEYIMTVNQNKIREGSFIDSFNQNIDEIIQREDIAQPFKNILLELKNSLQSFKGDNANIEAAIRWAHKYDMLMQAYTLAREYIIARVLKYVADETPQQLTKDKDRQEFISGILSLSEKTLQNKNGKLKGNLLKYKKEALDIWDLQIVAELNGPYTKLKSNRDSLDHALGKYSYQVLSDEFLKHFEKCVEIINKYCK